MNLPRSYIYREPFILDFEKPLPQALKTLDEQTMAKNKKYKVKYRVEDEYEHRNIEQD